MIAYLLCSFNSLNACCLHCSRTIRISHPNACLASYAKHRLCTYTRTRTHIEGERGRVFLLPAWTNFFTPVERTYTWSSERESSPIFPIICLHMQTHCVPHSHSHFHSRRVYCIQTLAGVRATTTSNKQQARRVYLHKVAAHPNHHRCCYHYQPCKLHSIFLLLTVFSCLSNTRSSKLSYIFHRR